MKQLKEIKMVSLFSGIGAFEEGLKNLGINYELVNYCEIDPHASKCYSIAHNVDENLNLWDVTKVDKTNFNNIHIDLLTHGSPCQSFSMAGKQEGGDEGSGTKSSLLWESVKIIEYIKPKFVIWENVKNVLSPKHIHNVNKYIKKLENIGYNNYLPPNGYLSAKDYGIPQTRDRVFIVSVLNEEKDYIFPKPIKLEKHLEDYLDFREKDDVTETFYNRYKLIKDNNATIEDFINYIENLPVKNGIGTKKMGLYNFNELDTITTSNNLTGTLCCRSVQNLCKKYWYNNKLYKPSPKMCFNLMGFSDEFYNKIKDIGKDKDLYDRAGNSIVVNVIQAILKELFLQYNYIK